MSREFRHYEFIQDAKHSFPSSLIFHSFRNFCTWRRLVLPDLKNGDLPKKIQANPSAYEVALKSFWNSGCIGILKRIWQKRFLSICTLTAPLTNPVSGGIFLGILRLGFLNSLICTILSGRWNVFYSCSTRQLLRARYFDPQLPRRQNPW